MKPDNRLGLWFQELYTNRPESAKISGTSGLITLLLLGCL
jgi:hypothetical protein